MSRNQYITSLERQLQALNQKIDAKIIRGQRYVEESHKHRMLLRKIREQKYEKQGFFGRVFA